MRKDYVKKVDEFNSKYYVNYIYEDISDNLDPSHMGVPIAGLIQKDITHWKLLMRESEFEGKESKIRESVIYHEYGHAFFAHHLLAYKGLKTLEGIINKPDYVERMAKISGRPKIYIKALLSNQQFIFNLLNIAADCEINSKILTLEDVEAIDKAFEADSIHPSKYAFLEGKTYLEYVEMVAEYLNLFLPPKQPEDQQGQGQGNGDGEGESGEGELKGMPGSGTGSNFITPDMIEKMVDEGLIDEDGNLTDKGKEQMKELKSSGGESKEGQGESSGSEGESGEQEGGAGKPDPRFQDNGRGNSGGAVLTRNTQNILKSMDDLFRDLRNKEVTKMTTTRNLFKNQLRGRSGNMYVPALKMNPAKVKVEQMTFLVDVSGSMDERSIFGIINDIATRVKKIGLDRVRLITWNTGFVQDLMIRDFEPKRGMLRIGGGTDLARGLKHIRELDEGVPIVVISDLCDDMKAWNREFDKIKDPKYVVTLGHVNKSDVKAINKDVKIFESDYD